MQTKSERIEASAIYPSWGSWLDNLESLVREKHGFGWGENFPKKVKKQMDLFQPMCSDCNSITPRLRVEV